MNVKHILLLTVFIGVIANLFYFSAWAPWVILFSRLSCGLGTSVSVGMSYVARVYKSDDLTSTLSKVSAIGQSGLLLGPCLNFLLIQVDFKIGSFEVNSLNSPGLLMAIILLGCMAAVALFFEDVRLPEETPDEERALLKEEVAQEQTPVESNNIFSRIASFVYEYKHLATRGILLLFVADFLIIFVQVTLETIITPMTEAMYGWGEWQNSVMYFCLGIEVILGFVAITLLPSSGSTFDLKIIFTGAIAEILALSYATYLLDGSVDEISVPFWEFLLLLFVTTFGLPFLAIGVPSIFAKMVPKREQGKSQGLMSGVSSIACVMAPLWAGWMLSYMRIMTSVMLVLYVALALGLALAFLKGDFQFVIPEKRVQSLNDTDVEPETDRVEGAQTVRAIVPEWSIQ